MQDGHRPSAGCFYEFYVAGCDVGRARGGWFATLAEDADERAEVEFFFFRRSGGSGGGRSSFFLCRGGELAAVDGGEM